MEVALFYESAAKLWGWPPSVLDDQPYALVGRMMEVAAIRAEVEAEQVKGANRG
jgi:hypothetical protein